MCLVSAAANLDILSLVAKSNLNPRSLEQQNGMGCGQVAGARSVG